MYIALMTFKVKAADGSYRLTKRGEEVPEAEGWKDPSSWERNGYIRKVEPAKEVDANSSQAEDGPKEPPEAVPEPINEAALEKQTKPAMADLGEMVIDLGAMTKAELQELAEKHGINPSMTKKALRAALEEKLVA